MAQDKGNGVGAGAATAAVTAKEAVEAIRERTVEEWLVDLASRRYLLNIVRKTMSGVRDEDAEDLVQTALLQGWRARAQWNGRASVKTWMTTVTVNCCRVRVRWSRADMRTGEEVPFTDQIADKLAVPETRWREVEEVMPALTMREVQAVRAVLSGDRLGVLKVAKCRAVRHLRNLLA